MENPSSSLTSSTSTLLLGTEYVGMMSCSQHDIKSLLVLLDGRNVRDNETKDPDDNTEMERGSNASFHRENLSMQIRFTYPKYSPAISEQWMSRRDELNFTENLCQ